jgi:hypothetical protein
MTLNAVTANSFLSDLPEESSVAGDQTLDAEKSINEVASRLLKKSFTLYQSRLATLSELQRVWQECATSNWDGEDADPLSSDVVDFAGEFVSRLPIDFPMPEVGGSATGEVVLDWIENQTRMATVYLKPSRQVVFAWVYDNESNHGSYMYGGRVDPRLTSAVLRLHP